MTGPKDIVRQFTERVVNGGDLDAARELMAEDFLDHNRLPDEEPGLAGVTAAFAEIRAAFPDLRLTVEDVVAEGDRVAARVTWRGTHRGPFLGVPPTGRRFEVTSISINRIADDRIVERWGVLDLDELARQLEVEFR
jgi:steroid delta-isomerase-like uncharacterized protein